MLLKANGKECTLTISNSEVYNNQSVQSPFFGGGAGILANGTNIEITDSRIHDNTMADYMGGGLYAYGCEIKIKNSSFFQNSGIGGGGIFLSSSSLEMQNGSIENNNAFLYTYQGREACESGGGISIINSSSAVLSGVTISGNTSDRSGGGVQVFSSSSLEMDGGALSGKHARRS